MSNYYTTLDLENGLFVGTLYDSVNNKLVYKTQPYPSQHQATSDINNFLVNKKPNLEHSAITPKPSISISNTIHSNVTPTTRKCCGR